MNPFESDFKFSKIKNGKPHMAIVNIDVEEVKAENEIIENYSGIGFKSQGYFESVPKVGYEDWKIAAKQGLNYILKLTGRKWKVKINSIEGRVLMDTNPAIVGYTIILAFCDKTNFQLDEHLREKLENFTFESWNGDNFSKIPNFDTLKYE